MSRTVAGILRVAAAAGSLLCAMSTSAGAQQGSRYQPGIDVLDYDIRLDLPDTGAMLQGDVTVTFRRSPGVSSLRLDLVRTLTVREVHADARTRPFTRDGDAIIIPLGNASRDSMQVRVTYDGVVTDGLIVRRDTKGRWTWFGDNWPDRARQWLPVVDHPSDKATVTWRVRAPTGRTVIANGLALGARPVPGEAGRTETQWREAHPIPTYLMVIGAGPLVRFPIDECATGRPGCVRQSVYVMPEERAMLPGPFRSAPAIVTLFERLVGPFPYERLDHLQSATRFGGMENATAIFYASDLFTTRRLAEGIIAHETAHQWFGDAVTEGEWGHLWLSEGFATYFAALWTREHEGEAGYRAEMARIRKEILADSIVAQRPVLDTAQRDYLALLNANSYQKGGYVLYMLHERLGERAFFDGLRAYYAAHRDGNALTRDLQRALEQSSGTSLTTMFDQWLRRPGVADVTLGWAWDAERSQLLVTVLQEEATPYDLDLDVSVSDAAGQRRRTTLRVPAERRTSLVVPWPVDARPRGVTLDGDDRLLAHVHRL